MKIGSGNEGREADAYKYEIPSMDGYVMGLIGKAVPVESLAAIVFHSTNSIKTCCNVSAANSVRSFEAYQRTSI